MDVLPLDAIQEIFNWLEYPNQIYFMSTHHRVYEELYVTRLFNRNRKINNVLKRLNNDVICQNKFNRLSELYLHEDLRITLSTLSNLHTLHAPYSKWLTSDMISNLPLTHLNVLSCRKIINVTKITSLQRLNIGGTCGIDQSGISGLTLTYLNANFNYYI